MAKKRKSGRKTTTFLLALVASVLVLIGVFAPAVKVPLYAQLSYFDLAGNASLVLMLAVVLVPISLKAKLRLLVPVLVLVSWAALLYPIYETQLSDAGVVSSVGGAISAPFRSMAGDVLRQITGYSWGGIPLLLGLLSLTWVAVRSVKNR